ncbi:hypothetical protein [Bradyrhizobium diazoefficiens]|nr:hypothetical protein [Bradyrhizobium diazoefficiens]
MRIVMVLALCAVVGGCGLMARRELEEKQQVATAQMQAGLAECKARFPAEAKRYVEKTSCDYNAAQAIRPFLTYPDLFDKEWAERTLLAERLQAGKLTLAEANVQAASVHSQIAEDEQRRNLASRSVNAQEAAAAAAWKSTSCTRIGNTVNCF